MRITGRKHQITIRLSGFDYFVLAGAGVNLLIVGYLIGYWLAAG
jgi:hypothetical protein